MRPISVVPEGIGAPALDFLSVPLPTNLSVEWWRARALESRVLIMRLNAKSDLSR